MHFYKCREQVFHVLLRLVTRGQEGYLYKSDKQNVYYNQRCVMQMVVNSTGLDYGMYLMLL